MFLELEDGQAGYLEISYDTLTNVIANLTISKMPMVLISNSKHVYLCLHTFKTASKGGFGIQFVEGK